MRTSEPGAAAELCWGGFSWEFGDISGAISVSKSMHPGRRSLAPGSSPCVLPVPPQVPFWGCKLTRISKWMALIGGTCTRSGGPRCLFWGKGRSGNFKIKCLVKDKNASQTLFYFFKKYRQVTLIFQLWTLSWVRFSGNASFFPLCAYSFQIETSGLACTVRLRGSLKV